MSSKLKRLEDVPGIGAATAAKLREAGYITVESIAVTPARLLAEATGLTETKAAEIAQAARELLEIDFVRSDELLAKRKAVARLTTGSKNLDTLLGGGIETQAMTELIGEYGVGKTQLCLTLCVTCQLPPEEGGLGGNALYIDAEGTFRPERIYQIASSRGYDPAGVLKNIITARAYNSDHQTLIVEKAFEVVPKENVKLVVLDSVISHFRSEYVGRESLALRQQKLNYHLHSLLRLAEAYNIAAVVTNQVIASPQVFFGPTDKPAGGHVLAHTATTRIYLRKSKGNLRIAHVIDSPYLPESEAVFAITERGIEDAPMKE
ncbi:MAG: DNA repair and recombination protein RadA [Candidatus Bathyarchaeia archaeon]